MQTLSKLSKGVWLKNLAITLVIVAVLLISGHAYVRVVQNNLWESSVNNAYSLTVQGRNNLQRQVLKDYEEANLIKHLYAQNASSVDKDNINTIMGRKQERKRRFNIVDADTQFSADTDGSFRELLHQYGNKTQGMLPVHRACEGVSAAWMRRLVANALNQLGDSLADPLPARLRAGRRLMGLKAGRRGGSARPSARP